MAQPITDYAAFFADAKQAVQGLEELKESEKQFEEKEKQAANKLKAKKKAVADVISQTVKQRGEEISESYDQEMKKVQERLKKVKAKREKARNLGIKGRIAEDTRSLIKENEELLEQLKTLFRANRVPRYCAGNLYYSLYFTRGVKEFGTMLLFLLLVFLVLPCGIYFGIPGHKTWYLAVIYIADILIFGGIYVKIGNSTKMKYMDVLKEGRNIRNKIRLNRKQIRVIARTLRRDKDEAHYDLEKFDDEIAQLDQDLTEINRKKKEALTAFDTVTKTILSDEIEESSKTEIEQMEKELEGLKEQLKDIRASLKDRALFVSDHYEAYIGKEFMTSSRLEALEELVRNGEARNINEAVTLFKGRNRKEAAQL